MVSHDAIQVASPISSSIPHRLATRSPRSSLDSSPKSPNSPFLHSISNRFRKGSNASNFSQASERSGPKEDPAEKIAETAQSAKRFVLSVVRNDWEWPPPEPATVSGGENITQTDKRQEITLAQREPVGWRTRFEGASDLDLDLSPVTGRRLSRRSSDPYKFESPDAIANAIQQQRLKRKRANAEETTWNEGLQCWTERRDAWTAARHQIPQKKSFAEVNGQHLRLVPPPPKHHKGSQSSEESKNTSSTDKSDPPVVNGINGTQRISIAVDPNDSSEVTDDDVLSGPFLPIYPPLFPTSHTLRARIKPASYPTIYSKVVLQSLSPNVPIPLTHMIGALVDGWKAEGQWPPQTLAEQQTHALLKRAKGSTKGESAFQKWRKERDAERSLRHPDNGDGIVFEDGFAGEFIVVEDDEKKKGLRKSISGAVKKVLGIHAEEDEDGGLAKLGLSFGNGTDVHDDDGSNDGLMRESKQVAEDNATLNKKLLNGNKR